MRFCLPLSFLFIAFSVQSQSVKGASRFQETHQLLLKRAVGPIVLDGELNEESWEGADQADDFWMKWPTDDRKAPKETIVRATYDDKFLYVSAVCYDTSIYVVQTLKRDVRYFDGDGFAVVIDPVNRKTNGFFFGVSPMNVQAEDLISGNSGNMNFSWDNRWFSEVKRYHNRWVVEMAIPFKTLRFEAAATTWGVNFIRNDLKANQYHTWTNVPVNFDGFDLGYTGSMVWDQAPDPVKTNISIIPFVSGSLNHDDEIETPETTADLNAGMDAKVAITSSMNLDLTLNPDFSQIEVDVQQTNLTRFSLNYPERRTFFLENADLFGGFGGGPFRPFFSRRIGLDAFGSPIPILAGARLSGNVTKNLRVGLLNMHTKPTDINPAQNYTAVAVNQRVFSRSLVKGYYTNRQSFVKGKGFDENDYGRNAGVEFNYSNASGSFAASGAYNLSDHPQAGLSSAHHYTVGYYKRNFSFFADYISVPTDYHSDMGFVPRLENYDAENDTIVRLGFEHTYNNTTYTIRPESGSINTHQFALTNIIDWNPDFTLNERLGEFEYGIEFKNTAEVGFALSNTDVRLPFATAFTDASPLPPGTYQYTRAGVGYNSDGRKPFAFAVEAWYGGFYNGVIQSYKTALTYRVQPWGNFSLSFEQNELSFPDDYGKASLTLLSQRSEINFSNSLFWITFFQYNTQQNNFNINSRLQWRYMPMSDLYVVYTDNYFTNPVNGTGLFLPRNKAIVFKLNYWLTI